MEYRNEVVCRITNELKKNNCKYRVEDVGRRYEIVLTDHRRSRFFIRCRHSDLIKMIRMHWIIDIDPRIVKERRIRLLEACDITNRENYIKAKVFEDCVDISFDIPESCWEIAEKVVVDVMYYFYMRIDDELFNKALNSNENLYEYYNKKVLVECE